MIGNPQKRLKKPSSPHQGGWEIVYSGFILILLCFFIMLCSFASMEGSKINRFVVSFNDAVNILMGGIKAEPGKIILGLSEESVDIKSDMARVYREVHLMADESLFGKEISLSVSEKEIVMRIGESALFESAVARITEESEPFLGKIGDIVRNTECLVRIEGHTDNLPIRTRQFPSNWELSTTRAVNVLRYLVEKEEIPAQRVTAVGFGEYKPLYSNEMEENRARNRRVEIIFVCEKTAPKPGGLE